ncbi:MAG: M3 family metallopeptidase, partial [Lysobacterales bacterium]
HTDFVRAGARLDDADKARLRVINAELAKLNTDFGQNVLKEANAAAVVVDNRKELAGLDDDKIAAAAEAAKTRKLEGKFVIALQNTSGQPPLDALTDRALRERIFKASLARGGHGGAFDNRAIVASIAKLRAERAKLLGYANHATYALEDQTAKSPAAVNKLLAQLAPAAVGNARREAADLQKIIDADAAKAKTEPFVLAGWDWDFYAEKLRRERYDFDATELRPYLELDRVLKDGVFHAAEKLYGLTFKERKDLPVYHPDVRVFEVFDNGKPYAIFVADMYARESKRGGAWMNAYVSQSELGQAHAVVANHLNIPKPPAGEPTLLTFREVTTLFHEFGHALHGMFSDVRYPRFSGTSVPRDFVEYPSQVNEMWATWPSVLANYAKHHETGAAMPQTLLDKVIASEQFNQGFATTEYRAATLLDQRWHQIAASDVPPADGVLAFEARALTDAGVDFAPVPPRYRTTYFSHIFAGGYSAGYYSYIWSEVLDADSVEWFKENGGLTRANGEHFRKTLLSRGGSADAMQLFRAFRGREPQIAPLLKRRGLSESAKPDAPATDDAPPPAPAAGTTPATSST